MSAPCSMGAPQPHWKCKPLWLALFGSVHKPDELGDMSATRLRGTARRVSGIPRPRGATPGRARVCVRRARLVRSAECLARRRRLRRLIRER